MFYETRRQPRRGVTLNGCFQRRFDNASGPNIQTCTIECFNYVADMSPSTPWTEEEMSYTYIARLHIKPEMEANFRQAIADMMEVASHDPGTQDYQVFTLADEPYSYVFYESYVDAYRKILGQGQRVYGRVDHGGRSNF